MGGICSPVWGLPESRWPEHASSLLLSLLSASLVPAYSFGENDIFHLKAFAPGSWQYLCQVAFKKLTSYSPCIFWGRGLFSANSWGLLPFARPITTVGEHPSRGGGGGGERPSAVRAIPHLTPSALSLQWAAPFRCPGSSAPPRRRSATTTRSTCRLWRHCLRSTRKPVASLPQLTSPLSSLFPAPQPPAPWDLHLWPAVPLQ